MSRILNHDEVLQRGDIVIRNDGRTTTALGWADSKRKVRDVTGIVLAIRGNDLISEYLQTMKSSLAEKICLGTSGNLNNFEKIRGIIATFHPAYHDNE